MHKLCLLIAELTVFGFLFAQTASAAWSGNWYVATNGTGQGTNGWGDATNNLQGAINGCAIGKTVLVSNGVYETGGSRILSWGGPCVSTCRVYISSAITVRSANNDPANTIIKGAWNPVTTNGWLAVRCVYMVANSTLIGFTLTNGATLSTNEIPNGGGLSSIQYGDAMGGGVLAQDNSAKISNCVITKCIAFGDNWNGYAGGGAFRGAYFNCTFSGNWTPYLGGGVQSAVLSNCTLSGNSAADTGGGTFANDGSPGTFYNCLFYGNSANQGGAVGGRAISLYNCTLVGNSASVAGGGIYATLTTLNVFNSIIYSNSAAASANWNTAPAAPIFTNSCTFPSKAGWDSANTTNNPLFVAFGNGYGLTHVPGDYHLQPNSPCVNRGLNQSWMGTAVDRDGRSRIDRFSGRVDMGCYEYLPRGMMFKVR